MALFKNLLHPLRAQSTAHLNDGEIQLLLRQYQWGSSYVGGLPSYFFKIADAGEIRREFGYCDLRVGMHPELAYAGHIGYRVYRGYRGHHYALKATRLLLHFACELGLEECFITCNPDNAASRRTLERLGGTLIDTIIVPENTACYKAGDREKCQFLFKTSDYFDPTRHNPAIVHEVDSADLSVLGLRGLGDERLAEPGDDGPDIVRNFQEGMTDRQ